MPVKTIGIITLLLTAFCYSQSRQMREKQNRQILRELTELFRYIRKHIECFTTPLGEICREYTSPVLEQNGFMQQWRIGHYKDAVLILPVSGTVRDVLLEYADAAGQGYKEDELRLCRYVEDILRSASEAAAGEEKAKTKMYRTLPYLLALSIVLLLY